MRNKYKRYLLKLYSKIFIPSFLKILTLNFVCEQKEIKNRKEGTYYNKGQSKKLDHAF